MPTRKNACEIPVCSEHRDLFSTPAAILSVTWRGLTYDDPLILGARKKLRASMLLVAVQSHGRSAIGLETRKGD